MGLCGLDDISSAVAGGTLIPRRTIAGANEADPEALWLEALGHQGGVEAPLLRLPKTVKTAPIPDELKGSWSHGLSKKISRLQLEALLRRLGPRLGQLNRPRGDVQARDQEASLGQVDGIDPGATSDNKGSTSGGCPTLQGFYKLRIWFISIPRDLSTLISLLPTLFR